MKFTSTFSALLVVLPLIANVSALAVPEEALVARQRGGFGRGGFNAGKGAKAPPAKAKTTAAAAKTTAAAAKTTAAAAATNTNVAVATGANNAAAGSTAAASGGSGDDSSLTLNPIVIQNTDNGQNPPVSGQSAALTSQNNFINSCADTIKTLPITNGLQITSGSCNPIPIGQIPASSKIPSTKFQDPINMSTIPANTAFNVTMAVKNIQIGVFTNAQKTYYANPQFLNSAGEVVGHTHLVIEQIPSITSTAVTDPQTFSFFKGVDDAADGNGNVVVPVAAGLPAGAYRFGTIMSSATHQPVIASIAQHGLIDDVIYVTVSDSGAAAGTGAAATAGAGTAGAGAAGAGAAGAGAAGAGTAATGAKAATSSPAPATAAKATTGKAATSSPAPATAAKATTGKAATAKSATAAKSAKAKGSKGRSRQ
jgi:hypothetical protein